MELLNQNEEYKVHHGDCIMHMHAMPEQSVDFAVYSPPFPAVFAYTNETADLGNSEELKNEAKFHFSCFFRALCRVMKPGRVVICHCTQIVRMKRTGGDGLYDFRGLLVRLGERAGLIYDYDWAVRKNPQAQAIRTKSHQLQFAGLERDRTQCRGANPDYLIKFRVPGENAVAVHGENQVTRNDWIKWAENSWDDIRETETLNVRAAKGESDVKHICPLQLEVIRRLIRLYSNPGEIVFSPFSGIGSEGYEAIRLRRRFYGCELKQEYYEEALRNLKRASDENKSEAQAMLFPMDNPVVQEVEA